MDHMERLKRKVVIAASGCWEFTGFRLPKKYGKIQGYSRGKIELAHRFSWMLHFGPIPAGMNVCHRCDNPPCVNPNHLFLGTASDNQQDSMRKGRKHVNATLPATRGERHWKNKLTLEQVRIIKSRASEPRTVLGREFGVRRQYISNIICGRKWAWV